MKQAATQGPDKTPSVSVTIHARFHCDSADDCQSVMTVVGEVMETLRGAGDADGQLTVHQEVKVTL